MTKLLKQLTLAILVVLGLNGIAHAQNNQADKIPVKLQVVISKYEGDRKVSSQPYTMFAIANGERAQITIGANVPIVSSTITDGKSVSSTTYTNIATNIDCTVTTESGRYKVRLDIRDNFALNAKTIASTANPRVADLPTIGTFSYSGNVSMKEGETKQFLSAADKISGELLKIDVTLTLDK